MEPPSIACEPFTAGVVQGNPMPKKKIAIIGSGCAGLGAAYALSRTNHEVHIFEKQSALGGHTNTQTWTKQGRTTPVDTGFIVMNTATYPNCINFLRDVGIETRATEMSFAVCRDQGKFEWSGSLKGIFAQRRNLLSYNHWRMILDIIRFNLFAPHLLHEKGYENDYRLSIGNYLNSCWYTEAFKHDYLIPMTAAVWSTPPGKASLEFPAKTLIRFMWNHHLLSTVAKRPDWYVDLYFCFTACLLNCATFAILRFRPNTTWILY